MAKYDSNWWFGENSMWSKTGAKEAFTGVKDEGGKKLLGGFEVPVAVEMTPEMKTGMLLLGGLLLVIIVKK
jgi:hypothetical protein